MLAESKKENHLKSSESKSFVSLFRGALGGLFQGLSADGENGIVVLSSLISRYIRAYFTPKKYSFSSLKDQGLATPEKEKSFRALALYCHSFGLNWPSGHWYLNSDLQIALGMASSTTDIVATLRCAASYFKRCIT